MIRLLVVLGALLVGACAHLPGQEAGAAPIRAMTFNIRLDTDSDGPNAWPHRKDMVAALIEREAPDLLGLQEVLIHQKRYLEAALPRYAFAGVGRDDGAGAGEFAPLAWRRDRFDLLQSGTFWLSPTPDTPGKGWDAAYSRIATWAVLRDRRTGRKLRALNTHFDHVGGQARAEGARMIVEWVARDSSAPAIVMGDFNALPDSPPYRILADTATSGLVDTRSASRTPPYGPPGTFTGVDIATGHDAPIDHVFATRGLAVAAHAVVTQHWGGRLPSDHYPVVVDFEQAP